MTGMRLLVVLLLSCLLGNAGEPLFDPDPKHPWNVLHRHFHTRSTADGKTIVHTGLEAALVRQSTFLTVGKTHGIAINLLDRFLQERSDRLITDPLKRSVLQRDLWAVFVATADPKRPNQPQRRALQKRLAQVMRRVALSTEQIDRLPDNLASAIESKAYPTKYLAGQSDRDFLPPALVRKNSGWIPLRNRMRPDNLVAPLHVGATHGRAAFFILLTLPDGRKATLDYLATLQDLPKRGDIPQIPLLTQVALVRRMILIDDLGRLRITPLTENIQIRVYGQLKKPEMFEFRLQRPELFAGKVGGLVATTRNEESYFALSFIGFSAEHRHDPLRKDYLRINSDFTPVVMDSCIVCHAGPGIWGFQSAMAGHSSRFPLAPTRIEDQMAPVIEGTRKTYEWGLLQGLWETR